MNLKNIFLITLLMLCTILTCGCAVYSGEESFVLDAHTYTNYVFQVLEGDTLEASINTYEGPIDIYIVDRENFYRYENLDYFEYDAYYENVLSSDIEFTIPFDGYWYLLIVNEENYDISLDISFEVY